MIPGVAGFSINTPQFENIKIDFSGKMLEIKGGSSSPAFIKSVIINDRKHTSFWIDWETIRLGGSIEYKTESNHYMKVN